MHILELRADETELLKDFLYEAIFIPEGLKPPVKNNGKKCHHKSAWKELVCER